jgi:hypothetical protein
MGLQWHRDGRCFCPFLSPLALEQPDLPSSFISRGVEVPVDEIGTSKCYFLQSCQATCTPLSVNRAAGMILPYSPSATSPRYNLFQTRDCRRMNFRLAPIQLILHPFVTELCRWCDSALQ